MLTVWVAALPFVGMAAIQFRQPVLWAAITVFVSAWGVHAVFRRGWRLSVPGLVTVFILSFLGWCVVAAARSVDPKASYIETVRYLISLTALFALCDWVRTLAQARSVLTTIATAGVGTFALYLGVVGATSAGMATFRVGERWLFGGINPVGPLAVFTLPILVARVLTAATGGQKAGPAAGICVAAVALVVSWSRASWAAACVGLALLIAFLRPRAARKALEPTLLVGSIGIVLWAAGALPVRAPSIDVEAALTHRVFLWRTAVAAIQQRPLTGWGPGAWPWALSATGGRFASPGEVEYVLGLSGQAHNLFLTKAVETGLVGAGLVGIFCVGLIGCLLRSRRWVSKTGWSEPHAVVTAVLAGLFIQSFFESGAFLGTGRPGYINIYVWLMAAIGLRALLCAGGSGRCGGQG